MKINYENYAQTTLITVSSELTGFLFVDAMNDSRLSRVARTSGKANEWVLFNLGTPKAITDINIIGHNLSATATVTLEGNATADFTTPNFEKVCTVIKSIWETFAVQTYQYWRISIQDTANVSAFIQIAYIFLGSGLDGIGMSPDQIITPKSMSKYTNSVSMQLYGDIGVKYKGIKINLPDMTQDDVELIDAFVEYVDIVYPFVLIMWEDDVDKYPPLYCHLVKLPDKPRAQGSGLLWTQSLEIDEVR